MRLKGHRTLYAPGIDTSPELDFTERPYSSSEQAKPKKLIIKTTEILIDDIEGTPLKVHIPLIEESRAETDINQGKAVMTDISDMIKLAGAIGDELNKGAEKKETSVGTAIDPSETDNLLTQATDEKTKSLEELEKDIAVDILLPPEEKTGLKWATGARMCKTTTTLPKPFEIPKSPPEDMYV